MLWKLLSRRMPALFTTMSMRPKLSSAVWTIAAPPSGVATELVSSDRLAAGGLDLVDDLLARPGVAAGAVDRAAEVVDDHERAPAGEQQRVLPPEAATRAGDDRHLAVETEIHHRRSTPESVADGDTVAVSRPGTPRPPSLQDSADASGAGVG